MRFSIPLRAAAALGLVAGLLPLLVHADAPSGFAPQLIPESGVLGPCNFITGEIHFDCVPIYLGYLIKMIFGLLGTICLLMIIWAGYEWALSGLKGDSSQAKARIRNAILGLVFAVLSFLIVDTIVSVLLSGPTS